MSGKKVTKKPAAKTTGKPKVAAKPAKKAPAKKSAAPKSGGILSRIFGK